MAIIIVVFLSITRAEPCDVKPNKRGNATATPDGNQKAQSPG
jgi:hypothetical protein